MSKDIQAANNSKQVYRGFDNRICFQINGNAKTRMEFAPLVVVTDQVGVLNLLDSPNTNGGGRRFSLPNLITNDGFAIARAWQIYSSIRYKENIENLNNGVKVIEELRPVSFKWKKEYGNNNDVGFIAEEVANVLPNVVSQNSDGTYEGLDYVKLTPYLTAAVKEQQMLIEEIREQIESLEHDV